MDVEIKYGPGNAAAHVRLGPRETCTAEAGSMISMSGDIEVSTTTRQRKGGGVLRGVRRALAGESFFLNHFTASSRGGEVWLAPTLSGDLMVHRMAGTKLVVQAGSFVACGEDVELDLGWQGFKSLLTGEGLFWIRLSGAGLVVLNAFGAIYPIDVAGAHVVDTGHIVAFEESLKFSITKAGRSWLSAFLGGEGLVCRFQGHGRVWCQSHNAAGFGRLLGPMLRPQPR